MELATFGGGCFWCFEPIFKELKGVVNIESGYSGGQKEKPTYDEVCTGETGHAEVVQITFNPSEITFKDLLFVFFRVHDPTTLNRQGNDVGTQYRSVIFYHTESQREIAQEYIKQISEEKMYQDAIVTELTPFTKFFVAEDYHQDFYERNRDYPYCQIIIDPKIKKFREEIKNKLYKNN